MQCSMHQSQCSFKVSFLFTSPLHSCQHHCSFHTSDNQYPGVERRRVRRTHQKLRIIRWSTTLPLLIWHNHQGSNRKRFYPRWKCFHILLFMIKWSWHFFCCLSVPCNERCQFSFRFAITNYYFGWYWGLQLLQTRINWHLYIIIKLIFES